MQISSWLTYMVMFNPDLVLKKSSCLLIKQSPCVTLSLDLFISFINVIREGGNYGHCSAVCMPKTGTLVRALIHLGQKTYFVARKLKLKDLNK